MNQFAPRIDPAALDALSGYLRGSTITPDHDAYDGARAVWNGMIDRRPALIVRCMGVADIMDALRFARERDLPVSVRGGGHNVSGSAVRDDGVLLDLSPMRAVRVDLRRRTARVEGGATWADVDRETQRFGLAAPGGVVSETGVAGLTLGGGYGHLRHKHGLSSDNVRSMDIVTAEGEFLTVSEDRHEDLFWALRGGGGHFGVVTSFEFNLHEVGPEIMGLGVFYPAEEAVDIFGRVREFASGSPDEITFDAILWSVPEADPFPAELQGEPIVVLGGMYAGPADKGEQALAPLRAMGTALMDISGRQPFVQLQSGFDPFFPAGLRYYWKSLYLDAFSDDAVDTIVSYASRRPSPRTIIPIRPRTGALTRVDPGATAFAERSSPWLLSIDSTWESEADDAVNIEWTREFWQAMAPYASNRMYFNFAMGEEGEEVARATFGPNYDRLAEIKARYDPEGVFGRSLFA
jgi:FAD/FMN-containing dehydrogenase